MDPDAVSTAPTAVNPPADGWSLTLPPKMADDLFDHLFGDGEEHGAVILAAQVHGPRGPRLLARHLVTAVDGVDYVEGTVGYRALTPNFVRDNILRAGDEQLAYLAVHNHGGHQTVRFSRTDLTSHERGYPALRAISGQPVGAVVFAPAAAAGDLWLPSGDRVELAEVVIPGNNLIRLQPRPTKAATTDPTWDRQTRLFGDRGQQNLNRLRVAIVGAGGAGSIITEFIARMGIGSLVLVDPDDVDETNLPRLVGAERADVGQPKVDIAARNAIRANPLAVVERHATDLHEQPALGAVAKCDWIFLAADTNAARHYTNKLVQQQLIPATQVGVKVPVADGGRIGQIHTITRLLLPGHGCLWCNQLINPTDLAVEMLPDAERRQAQYVPGVPAPSVMALNGLAASEAANHFMLATACLHTSNEIVDLRYRPRAREHDVITPRQSERCDWCNPTAAAPVAVLKR